MGGTDEQNDDSNDKMLGIKPDSIGIYNKGTIDVSDGGVINIYNSQGDKSHDDKKKAENKPAKDAPAEKTEPAEETTVASDATSTNNA